MTGDFNPHLRALAATCIVSGYVAIDPWSETPRNQDTVVTPEPEDEIRKLVLNAPRGFASTAGSIPLEYLPVKDSTHVPFYHGVPKRRKGRR